MRNTERFLGFRNWVQKNLCDGREMKAPAPDMDISQVVYQEPRAYIGWTPRRPDQTGQTEDPVSAVPSILIMPTAGFVKHVEEQHFDRYKGVGRGRELGQSFNVDLLFSVYEPGVRLPGFSESAAAGHMDMTKIMEGTEQGLLTLYDWMDDATRCLLRDKSIPGTDLFLVEDEAISALYMDGNYVIDRRPVFYGFLKLKFLGYAEDGNNTSIEKFLN